MYRDLIEAIERIVANGRTWYYQRFNRVDGKLKAVNLYDQDGTFVGEFEDMKSLEDFVMGVK